MQFSSKYAIAYYLEKSKPVSLIKSENLHLQNYTVIEQ